MCVWFGQLSQELLLCVCVLPAAMKKCQTSPFPPHFIDMMYAFHIYVVMKNVDFVKLCIAMEQYIKYVPYVVPFPHTSAASVSDWLAFNSGIDACTFSTFNFKFYTRSEEDRCTYVHLSSFN